ncbi:MAG: hypothetical protein H6740_28240 [Alphaproteobacteria bacterium]|nr:hypothetical protein [Alphaproteobacteria bacterium]
MIITFKGNAPSIARALSEHGHQDFYRTCLTHTHFFSFIDMAGRLLIVNRSKVERLMLLDEADDRAPDELLQAGHDRPPNNPLAAFFEHQGCGFNTGHETDRALQIVAELYMEGAFTKEALAKVQASEPHSQLAAGIAEVGVLRLAHIGELLSKSSNPYFVAEQLGGRLVDVHLASGLSRTVTLSEGDYQYLFIDGDLLEDGATGGSLGVLQAEEEGLVEFFNWQDIAWVETSALSAHEAFQEEMDLLGEG